MPELITPFHTVRDETASKLYERLSVDREPYLRTAHEASELTIPSLLPRYREHGGDSSYSRKHQVELWQSVGSRGVENLASKLLLTLLPTTIPPFRMVPDQLRWRELDEEVQREVERDSAAFETETLREIDRTGLRMHFNEALEHMVVAGNFLTKVSKTGPIKGWPLDAYVVQRDYHGEVRTIIIKETVRWDSLPGMVQEGIEAAGQRKDERVNMFTWIELEGSEYTLRQEIHGVAIKAEGPTSWSKAEMPYTAHRMRHVDGESYGRGYVDRYLGDLRSLESLSKSLVQGAAASARVIFGIKPGAATPDQLRQFSEKPNGSFIGVDPEAIGAIQADKSRDLAVADATAQRIEQRLSRAFLLNQAFARDSERTTAFEINETTQELDDALGGNHTVLSQQSIKPLIELLILRLRERSDIPKPPEGLAEVAVITGLDALGRGQELRKMDIASQAVIRALGPEVFAQHVNAREYIEDVFINAGVDPGFIRTEEEIQQAQQQAQLQQALESPVGQTVAQAAIGSQ